MARLSAIGTPPLGTQEIGLMLRSGYTSDEVLQEVTHRRVLDPLDGGSEKTLRDLGADARLIATLKSGQYTVPAADADAVKLEQQAGNERLEAEREAGQDKMLAQARQSAEAAVSRKMSNLLRGKLVTWKDGRLQPYDDNVLGTKKVFAVYYSASWCGPCQQFTPWLIQFYQQFVPTHPHFEVVLVSDDRSAQDMQKYMQADNMPWPALAYDRKAQEPALTQYAGRGIPCLVLVDGAGAVLSDSYDGAKYLGPRHVLEDLARMAGVKLQTNGQSAPPAQASAAPPATRNNPGLAGERQ